MLFISSTSYLSSGNLDIDESMKVVPIWSKDVSSFEGKIFTPVYLLINYSIIYSYLLHDSYLFISIQSIISGPRHIKSRQFLLRTSHSPWWNSRRWRRASPTRWAWWEPATFVWPVVRWRSRWSVWSERCWKTMKNYEKLTDALTFWMLRTIQKTLPGLLSSSRIYVLSAWKDRPEVLSLFNPSDGTFEKALMPYACNIHEPVAMIGLSLTNQSNWSWDLTLKVFQVLIFWHMICL